MHQRLNLSFLGILLLFWAAGLTEPWQILIGLFLALFIAYTAYYTNRLTFDGMVAATIVGTIVYGFGGLNMALVLLMFFILSSIFSRDNALESPSAESQRNALQVWANGFWIATGIVLHTLTEQKVFAVFALASVAAATADTLATELKSRKPENTYLFTTFEQVSPGTNGGVSLQGTLVALLASFGIAGLSVLLFYWGAVILFVIGTAGFLGCLVDSYIGATWERSHHVIDLPIMSKRITINNEVVNLLSSGLAALLAMISYLMITFIS